MIMWILNHYGRIAHRLRAGGWCDHEGCWGDWEMIDLGRNKVRHCRCCTGAGEWVDIPIPGPEPEHVGQYARKPAGDGWYRPVPDMDALRVRTVRATEWRRPSTITLDALKRKAGS